MSKSAYPTHFDLMAFLIAAQISEEVVLALDLETAITSARVRFEDLCGRSLLAVTGTRSFDPPGGMRSVLPLRADLAQLTSLSIGGVVKVLNTDFWLGPENADANGQPWSWVEFANPFSSVMQVRKSISITGKWGFGVTLTDDDWEAIRCGGAASVQPQIAAAVSGGLSAIKLTEDNFQFNSGGAYSPQAKDWQLRFERQAQIRKRVTVGI